jgi:hypothetical protein
MSHNPSHHGKQPNQRIKPYIVVQYLLKHTDEMHVASANTIVDYLREECGIWSERRSIYKDVEDINKVMYMLENNTDIYEAEEVISTDEDDEDKYIVYDKHKKGFYAKRRKFDIEDMRLLAECIYSSKFINESQSHSLIDVVCEFVSESQAEQIRHDVFLTDRTKTTNKEVLNNITTINEAMSTTLDGKTHIPEKISFQYIKYDIEHLERQTRRRGGNRYTVSPFKLLINDGNYYLLSFDEDKQDLRTFRIDRMKSVKRLNIPRDGTEYFENVDLNTYTKRVFSMFGGESMRITIRFINPLLDTVVDRFGTKGTIYQKSDNKHFSIITDVEISDQFFGWVCSFGNKARITAPAEAVRLFEKYIDKIKKMYTS